MKNILRGLRVLLSRFFVFKRPHDVVRRYSRAWRLLLEYDEDRLREPQRVVLPTAGMTLREARAAIACLRDALLARGEAGPLFGVERGEGLEAILEALEQTFGGEPLYPSVQVRAANLLYLVVKDHPFADGNKRIATLLFLEYLRRNGLLMRADGTPRFADNAMVALTLLIAQSAADQKDLMIRLIVNLME